MAAAAAGNSKTAAIKAAMADYSEEKPNGGPRLLSLLTPETVNTAYVYPTSGGIERDRPLELAILLNDFHLADTLVRELGANTLTYGTLFKTMDLFFDATSSEEDKARAVTIISGTLPALSLSDIWERVTAYKEDWIEDRAPPTDVQVADLLHRIALRRIDASREKGWNRRRHAVNAHNKRAVGGARRTRRLHKHKHRRPTRKH